MGGAISSSAIGHEAIYYNPAGLAWGKRPTFSLGYQYASFALDIRDEQQDVQEAPALSIGFSMPLPLGGIMKDKLALGLGFVLPQTSIFITRTPYPGTPHFPVLENRAQGVSILGGIGIQVTDWMSCGAGFIALAELNGSIETGPNQLGEVGAKVHDSLLADYSPVFGVVLHPSEEVQLSMVYRDASRAAYALPVKADLGSEFPIPIPLLDLRGVSQFDPGQINVELSIRPSSQLLLAASASRVWWSDFTNPIVYTAVPDDYPPQPEPNFSDIWVWRLGAEWATQLSSTKLAVRSGYVYYPTPTPHQTGLHNYLDNTRQIWSAGLGLEYSVFQFNAGLQLHVLTDRKHTKNESEATTDNEGYPTIHHGGHILVVGAETVLEF
tara:strand:+ start:251 stop:1396 length:1146 start_codon:yes stop_codon:yes gene_type:complete